MKNLSHQGLIKQINTDFNNEGNLTTVEKILTHLILYDLMWLS